MRAQYDLLRKARARTCQAIIDMLARLADDERPDTAGVVASWTLPDGNGDYDVPIEVSSEHFVEIGYRSVGLLQAPAELASADCHTACELAYAI